MSVEPRSRVLIGVLAVLVVIAGVRMFSGVAVQRGLGDLGAVLRAGDRTDIGGLEVLELRDSRPREPAEFRPGRDPWRFATVNAAPPKPAPQVVAPPPPAPTSTPVGPPPSAVPSKPQPPPVDVQYLGSFGPDHHRIAVFTDKETIYNAAQGDVFKGKFRVHDIGYESVDVAFVGFPDATPKRLAIGGGR